ncbi:MAG: hypothetical protein NC201_07740 [Prevotella sp.]|nr:hypothetical protein [Bacteroides sp.]MCM1367120.1 hypothetical protein [Prevotella sp.]MCM1437349.1 hypothetical protein [Prevotella sp.]
MILSLLQLLVVFSSCSNDDDDNRIGYLPIRDYTLTDDKGNSFKFRDLLSSLVDIVFPSFGGTYTVTADGERFRGKISYTEEWDIQTIRILPSLQKYDITDTNFLNKHGISSITKTSTKSWTIHLLQFSDEEPKRFRLAGTIRFKGEKRDWSYYRIQYPEGSPVDQLFSGKINMDECMMKLYYDYPSK